MIEIPICGFAKLRIDFDRIFGRQFEIKFKDSITSITYTTHGSSFFKTKKLPKERPLNYENIGLVWMKNAKIKKFQGGKLKK